MSKIKILLFLLFFTAPQARAATYWVSTSGKNGQCTNSASPQTTGAEATIAAGAACMGANDTLYIRTGTYSSPGTNNPTAGSGGNYTTISNYNGETVTVTGPVQFYSSAAHHIKWVGTGSRVFKINTSGASDESVIIGNGSHHIWFENMEITGATRQGVFLARIADQSSGYNTIKNNWIHAHGAGNMDHCMYIESHDNLVEYNTINNCTGYGIHQYNGYAEEANNNVYRYNVVYGNATVTGFSTGQAIVSRGNGSQFYGNILKGGLTNGAIGLDISRNNGSGNIFYNNVIYEQAIGILVAASSVASTIKNNVIANNTSNFEINGSGTHTKSNNFCTASGGTTNCSTSGASAGFVNAASGDFSLTSSSALIDAGTSSIATGITLTCAGSCDIGAFEGPKIASCAATSNTLSITFDNPRFPPISNLATTGITATVDGSTRTLSGATLVGTNQVNYTFSGAAASATASTAGTSVAITDSASIGGSSANVQKILNWASTGCNVTGGGSAVLTQTYFRFHDLPGTEAAPKCLSASGSCTNMQNVAAVIQQGGSFRVRGKIACTGAACLTAAYEWRYNKDGGAYARVPDTVASDRISYYGTTDTSADVPSQGTQTTELLTSDHSTNVTGAVIRTGVAIPSINSPAQNSEWEMEGIFHFERDASAGSVFCFRLYNQDGTALNAYNATPCATVAAPAMGGGFQMGALSPLGPWDVELRLGSELKLGKVRRRTTDRSRFVYPEVPKSAVVNNRQ